MNDELGQRMKANYEHRYRILLPRRTNYLVRVDGKAFHSYTRTLQRPFDEGFMKDMNMTAKYMCQNMQGAKFAYVQSDEISILLTDYDTIKTSAWFDGNIQKIASISASMATAQFNYLRAGTNWNHQLELMIRGEDVNHRDPRFGLALFDARVFVIPDPVEVHNYFIWRQQDAARNSVQLAGQSKFSPSELRGKSCAQIQEELFSKHQINWNSYPVGCKRGRAVVKHTVVSPNPYKKDETVERTEWTVDDQIPIFTQDRDYLAVNACKI